MDLHYQSKEHLRKKVQEFLYENPAPYDSLELFFAESKESSARSKMLSILSVIEEFSESRFLVVLGLPFSESILTQFFADDEKLLEKLDVYKVNKDFTYMDEILSPAEEECRIKREFFGHANSFFRSWRDAEAVANNWEYCNSLYFIF